MWGQDFQLLGKSVAHDVGYATLLVDGCLKQDADGDVDLFDASNGIDQPPNDLNKYLLRLH